MKISCLFKSLLILTLLLSFERVASAQMTIAETEGSQNVGTKRRLGLQMLDGVKDIVKQYYYDPKFHGTNLDERFKTAKEVIKTRETNSDIFRVIAQVLLEFNDSHTKFYPPSRSTRVEYGFSLQAIGNICYIVDVKRGSDAESKGLKPGDQVLELEGYQPSRANLWVMEYILYHLEPRGGVNLLIKDPAGKEKKLEILSKLRSLKDKQKEKQKNTAEKPDYKCSKLGDGLIACKLYSFVVENKEIDKMMTEVGTSKKLILDLRGNGGGYLKALSYLTGFFFDQNVKIGDEKMRDKTQELVAKPQKNRVFKGDLIVLTDSDSGSAAEMFAGMIQVEKRGKVIGDISAGAVMASYNIPMATERGTEVFQTLSFYNVSITIADFILSDGKRLEGVGVIPDVHIGPSPQAILKRFDPVLAYSAQEFGINLSQDDAGLLNFIIEKSEEPKEKDKEEKKDN